MFVTCPFAYISGPLTDMSEERRAELRAFYERLAAVCERVGLAAYVPHRVSDPKLAASLTPEEVDALDREAVTRACLIIAYVGEASTGVGIEVEIAHHAARPVWLLFEDARAKDRRISRLVRGNPAVENQPQIRFQDADDACDQLEDCLRTFCARMTEPSRPELLRWQIAH
jgi:hypothetical protein